MNETTEAPATAQCGELVDALRGHLAGIESLMQALVSMGDAADEALANTLDHRTTCCSPSPDRACASI